MRTAKALVFTVSLAALAITGARDAAACGGCFPPEQEVTQVTGHEMALSISQDQTTLWDRITYSGDPSSFAWVLPIKGIADVDVSSDAMFQYLAQNTQVTIASPPLNCPPPPNCGFDNAAEFGGGSGGGGGGGDGVTVLAQEVVGPFETVQLQSTVPGALNTWLADHGYAITPDIQQIVDTYVAEGFNFLAMKLVPGTSVSAMRPVRITTQGASPTLPLRMVAAGTGAITPITLWVLAEGRYEPANLPSFTIDPNDIVWNWGTQSSNYATLKDDGFKKTSNTGWLTEVTRGASIYDFQGLEYLAQYDPVTSGYGDAQGVGAVEECAADLDALYGHIPETSLWITRLTAELSRPALAADLQLQASSDQGEIYGYYQADKAIGVPPPCPVYSPCENGGPFDFGFDFGWDRGGNGSYAGGGGGCAITAGSGIPALGGLALMAALALARRRRR